MAWHHLGVLALAAVTAACVGRPQPHAPPPVAQPHALETLVFPSIDPATLDSLHTLLGRLAQDSALLSALDPTAPRMYALFRQLEAAQRAFEIALATPDATGRTLHDRLMETTAWADSLFRQLEEQRRKFPRP